VTESPQRQNEANLATAAQDWTDMMAAPARYVHPERIVACYNGAITIEIATRLRASKRIQRHLAILLTQHFELSALPDLAQPDDADLLLMTSPAEQISDLVLLAGAIFWSHIFASEIRTNAVAEMKRRVGETGFQRALANRDLASNLPGPNDLCALEAMVTNDGLGCIAGWHDALAARLRPWARLKHANDSGLTPSLNAAHRKLGPLIMRRLAASLPSPIPQDEVQ
jgi:hypothetical protein